MTETLRIEIQGMTCASCVGRVEKALGTAEGVSTAQVNLATETATIDFDPTLTSPVEIAKVSTKAGYPASVQIDPAAQQDRKADEAIALSRRVKIAAILTIPVFALAMGAHFIPGVATWIDSTIGAQADKVIQFALTTLIMIWPGADFYRKGVPALLKGAPDMNALVALGTLAAWGFSTIATFTPSILPAGSRGVYFEAAAVIITLILLGRLLEARAKGQTGDAIRKLIGLAPKQANVLRKGKVIALAIEKIVVSDIVEIKPGEQVAVDGTVTEGSSLIDESMLTGEPIPVRKTIGDPVTGGTINGSGTILVEATKVGADTTLAQIIRMVQDAQGARLPIQELVNKVTGWFVPVVLVLATLTVIVWLTFGPDPALGLALVSGVSVLIVACPCAMGLATPTSIMVGTGRAAEMGVLFRKGDALQQLQSATIVAFDKTGTLTKGKPTLMTFSVTDGHDDNDVLQKAASIEALSEHPIGSAIVTAATDKGLEITKPNSFSAIAGYGVQATIDGDTILIGAARLMDRENIDRASLADQADTLAQQGQTPFYMAINGKLAALFAVTDPIKDNAAEIIRGLHAMDLKVAMITGDDAGTAQNVAGILGIDTVIANVLPDGKVAALDGLRKDGDIVAFVGDGINDAPALASADIGIAIGSGTDVAIESADMVLMSGDLSGVMRAFAISHATMRNIRQNLFWAFAYNAALIPVAAGVLYPINGMLLSPMLAAGAMALSSVFVVTNALRLRRAGLVA